MKNRLVLSNKNETIELAGDVPEKRDISLDPRSSLVHHILSKMQWSVAAGIFACCVAPTFISYQSYVFRWDDADYLRRAIEVSRIVWSSHARGTAHLREIVSAVHSFRLPTMALLGIPWGPLASWDAAGKCFLTLAILISLFAAVCIFLLARIGVKPLVLTSASVCIFFSIGPIPSSSLTHHAAIAFMTDYLLAWISVTALLLIPHEVRIGASSICQSLLRGILWGLILSLGTITKISFLYFVVTIASALLITEFFRLGRSNMLAALAGLTCSSIPVALYLVKYGGSALANGETASFGSLATYYETPFLEFVSESVHGSPGLMVFIIFTSIAAGYLAIRKRISLRNPDFVALLIVVGYSIIVLASVSRLIRYSFPTILSLPLLFAVLLSEKAVPLPRKSATLTAAFVFCVLISASLPMRAKAQREASLGRADAVLSRAIRCNDRSIILATDSPTLNSALLGLAASVTELGPGMRIDTIVNSAMDDVPIREDFRVMQNSDMIVFQNDDVLSPPFTNQRVAEYRSFMQSRSDYTHVNIGNDLVAYLKHCGS